MLTLTQQNIEADFLNKSYEKAMSNFIRDLSEDREYNTQPGIQAINDIHKKVVEFLEEEAAGKKGMNTFWKNFLRPLIAEKATRNGKSIDDLIADVVAINIITAISTQRPFLSVAANMSDAAFTVLNIKYEEREEHREHCMKFFMGICQDLVELKGVNLYEITSPYADSNDDTKVLVATAAWNEAITKAANNIKVKPTPDFPMVCKPGRHHTLFDVTSGYAIIQSPLMSEATKTLEEFEHNGKMKKRRVTPIELMNFTAETNPKFFDLLNEKQETAYCINKDLLAVIEYYYNLDGDKKRKKKFFPKYPSTTRQISDVTKANIDEAIFKLERQYKEVWDSEKNKATKVCKQSAKNTVNRTLNILRVAKEYQDYHELFFSVYLDYRSRIYTYVHTGGLTYMGGDMAKALLHLADKREVTKDGISQMYQTLGNCLDFGKKSITRKEKMARAWYDKHHNRFKNGYFDIFFNADEGFDEPVQALALVLELLAIEKNPKHKTGIICHRDARCSGISITGTATGDRQAMELTSVLDTIKNEDADLPDAYSFVANRGYEMNTVPYFKEHKGILFDRSTWKKPVMTRGAYGATLYTIMEENATVFAKNKLDMRRLSDFNKLMMAAIDSSFPSLELYRNAMEAACNTQIKEKGYISYAVPFSNFPVVAFKFQEDRLTLESPVRYTKIQLVMNKKINEMDVNKTVTALGPGCIHSLDASLLLRVQAKLPGVNLTCVHDSVGSHPNDVANVVKAYAEAMYDLTQEDVLGNIFAQMGGVAPKVNTITTEELSDLKNSLHCLA